jgi:hypothetical protein
MTYSQKLKDPRWQQKRLRVMERDGFTCRDCGADDKHLHVHHCHYEKGEPWEIDDLFLLTLCEECHEIRGERESDCKRALAIILSRMPAEELNSFVHNLVRVASDSEMMPVALIGAEQLFILSEADADKNGRRGE